MTNRVTEYLEQFCDEIVAYDFYRELFPEGTFQEKGVFEKFKYNGIIVEITSEKKKNGKPLIYRHTLTDELDKIEEVGTRDNFCLMSAVDYVGKSRDTANARNMYALVIEIDEIKMVGDVPYGMMNLFKQFGNGLLPKPTYIVSSGNGIHLYYLLDEPVRLYCNVLQQLELLKKELTRKLWHDSISSAITFGRKVQYEPVCQGFRVVGTITRKGTRTRAFEVGERVTIGYLNEFVSSEYQVIDYAYKNDLNLEEAKAKYPEWYQTKVLEKQPKGAWSLNRSVYEWWRDQIGVKADCGHRYWCLWILAVYAKKCSYYDEKKNPNPVTLKELEQDSLSFLEIFDSKTSGEFDPFTADDVLSSLKGFDTAFVTYPIGSIIYRSGIHIEKNKRNGLNQNQHLYLARRRKEDMKAIELPMKAPEGRPSAEQQVKQWQKDNPTGKKVECIRATGLSKPTVYRWWK